MTQVRILAGQLLQAFMISVRDYLRTHSEEADAYAAINLPISPEMYREDMLVSLGLEPRGTAKVERSALNLAKNLLEFLKQRKPDIDPQPDLTKYLVDGTLERRLND